MKKSFIRWFFLSLGVFLCSSIVFADIRPPYRWYTYQSCVKITNLDQFPEIVLIACYTSCNACFDKTIIIDKNHVVGKAHVIKNNEDFGKNFVKKEDGDYFRNSSHYKPLSIYWTTQDKFKSMDTEALTLEDLTLLCKVNIFHKSYFRSEDDKKEYIDCLLVKKTDTTFELQKSEYTSTLDMDKQEAVEKTKSFETKTQ